MVLPMPLTLPRFNSMKVRLKHNTTEETDVALMFQFHEGPIKTALTVLNEYAVPVVSIP